MRIVAIIQARMGSTRLSGKVLRDISGKSMLERVVSRTRRAKTISDVVVATSTATADDQLEPICGVLAVSCFRGSESDVLDRYYRAATSHLADVVVRITSDCPLIDPHVIDKVMQDFLNQRPDYASNTLRRTFPRGLDTEVFTFEGLDRCWRDAKESYQRAHVTPYFYQHPELFRLLSVENESDHGEMRWTVDSPEDLEFVRAVYDRLGPGDDFGWQDVLRLLEREPELADVNRMIQQKSLHEG